MKPAPFAYHAPTTAADVVDLLAAHEGARVTGGGQSLAPLLNMRLAFVEHLIDLRRVADLTGIERRDDAVWIGAATTQAAAAHSDVVARDVPLLAAALPLIGHVQIRNRGTVGGSIAHADPAAEIPAVALALDARIETLSPRGPRTIPAAEFFTGVWTTALDEDELLTGVSFPVWSDTCGVAVDEVARRHGDFAIAGACVAVEVADDTVRRCAIGLLGLGSTPVRAAAAERAAIGARAVDLDVAAIGTLAVAGLPDIPSDLNGSAEYRAEVGAVVVRRALTGAVEEARRG